jgi:type IV secretion system protein TrbI
MNFSDLSDRVRSFFPQREFTAPPPPSPPAGGQQPPVTIVMSGQTGRKVSVPVMVVGASVVLIAMYFAGHSSAHVDTPTPHGNDPTPTSPSNIKDWNKPVTPQIPAKTPAQQAEEAFERNQQEQVAAMQRGNQMYAGQPPGSIGPITGSAQGQPALTPAQQLAEDRRKADEESLRSSTVIAIPETTPVAAESAPATPTPAAAPVASISPAAVAAAEEKNRKDCVDRMDGEVKKYALCEGAVLPAISEFRLVGEFAGPVKAEIASDIFARDGKHLLIPRGTVALGDAKRVGTANQHRMDVSFHRMILPDGRGVTLEKMIALDQAGETALSGKVNRHLVSTFGTAALLGGLAGFSQIGAGSAYTGNGIDAYRQGVASGIGQQGQTVLQQGLNRPPDITVPEGKFLMIYLSDDLHLPEFVPAPKTTAVK